MSYFYHSQLRDLTIAFGSMFDHLTVRRRDRDGNLLHEENVPISYSNKSTYYLELRKDKNLDYKPAVKLPRMGFSMTGMQYDPNRQLNNRDRVLADDGRMYMYNGIPYNVQFELYISSKTQDEGLQIIEQILPFFKPYYTITIKAKGVSEFDGEDVPIVLDSVANDNNYEGPIDSRRTITWELRFTAKTTIYGPKRKSNLIRKVVVEHHIEDNHSFDMIVEPYVDGVPISEIKPGDDYGISISVNEDVDNE